MVYDVKQGHRTRAARFSLSRAAPDLRRPAGRGDQAGARRPAAAGRTELCRAAGGGDNRDSVGQLRACAVFVLLGVRPAGAADVSAAGAGRQESSGHGPGHAPAGALCEPQMAATDLRFAPRTGPAERGANPLFDAKHSPYLVLALFSEVLGKEQKDWPANTLIAGFCYYDADAGNAALPPQLEKFHGGRPAPVVFTLGSAAVLAAGKFYEFSAKAAMRLGIRAVLLIGTDPRNRPRKRCLSQFAWPSMRPIRRFFRAPPWLSIRAAWAPRRNACARASRCSSCLTRTTSPTTRGECGG